MNLYDDYDPFAYGDDEPSKGENKEENETRKRYFEEELTRYREEKRRDRDYSPGPSKQRAFLSPEILEALVDYCIENDKFEEALHFSKLLTDHAPFPADAWHRRGMIEAHHAQFEEAVHSYEKALSLDPTDPELLVNYGIVLESLGKTDDALHVFDRALTSDPANDDALFSKGICYEKADRFHDAISIFRYLAGKDEFAKDAY